MIENHSQNRFWVILLCGLALSSTAAMTSSWSDRVPLIEQKLLQGLGAFRKGDIKLAKKLCDDAYFGVFEDTEANMEVAIRKSVSLQKAAELEGLFGSIRKQFSARAQEKDILASIKSLLDGIRGTAHELDKLKVNLKQ